MCATMTDDPEPRGFRAWRKAADARVRRANQADMSNVVPLKRPRPRREFRLPAMPTSPVVLWGGILAILIVVYLVQRAL
jgi:hypothetical protein